jgi:hypothetical protein
MNNFNRKHRKGLSFEDYAIGLFTMLFIVLIGLAEGM